MRAVLSLVLGTSGARKTAEWPKQKPAEWPEAETAEWPEEQAAERPEVLGR
jgi:hypothetical protein